MSPKAKTFTDEASFFPMAFTHVTFSFPFSLSLAELEAALAVVIILVVILSP